MSGVSFCTRCERPLAGEQWALLLRPTPASRECSQSRMRLRLRSMPPCIIRVYMPTKAHATWLATFSAASLVVRQSGGFAGAITWLCEPRDRKPADSSAAAAARAAAAPKQSAPTKAWGAAVAVGRWPLRSRGAQPARRVALRTAPFPSAREIYSRVGKRGHNHCHNHFVILCIYL